MDELEIVQSDLFENIPPQGFDLIVSNPPYVDAADMAELSDEFKAEPNIGLAAGDDGLDIVSRILQQAPTYLSEHGMLVVEVGNSQAAMMQRFPDLPLTWIEFEHGGDGVFCIDARQLREHLDSVPNS